MVREIKIEAKAEKKAEDFIMEANLVANNRTAFVGPMAERLFQEKWKVLHNVVGLTDAFIDEEMDECIHYADMFRRKINEYKTTQAEEVHNDQSERAAKSGLVLPSWGEIAHHFPGGVMN